MEQKKPDLLVFAIGFLFFFVCIGYLLLYLLGSNYQTRINTIPKAEITILPPSTIPTIDMSYLIVSPTKTVTPGNALDGEFPIDSYVQITGTGGNGLRLRANPGIESSVNFIAAESEVFRVIDGPVKSGDYSWWLIVAPYDDLRRGWAASDFLSAIKE